MTSFHTWEEVSLFLEGVFLVMGALVELGVSIVVTSVRYLGGAGGAGAGHHGVKLLLVEGGDVTLASEGH